MVQYMLMVIAMMDSWCYENLNLMVWWIVDNIMDSWCYDGKLMTSTCSPTTPGATREGFEPRSSKQQVHPLCSWLPINDQRLGDNLKNGNCATYLLQWLLGKEPFPSIINTTVSRLDDIISHLFDISVHVQWPLAFDSPASSRPLSCVWIIPLIVNSTEKPPLMFI